MSDGTDELRLALKIAMDTLIDFSKAPYHGTTDWEQEVNRRMLEAAKTLADIHKILGSARKTA